MRYQIITWLGLGLMSGVTYAQSLDVLPSKCRGTEEAAIAAQSPYIEAIIANTKRNLSEAAKDPQLQSLLAKFPELTQDVMENMRLTAQDEQVLRQQSARNICKSLSAAEHDELTKFYQGQAGQELLRQQIGLQGYVMNNHADILKNRLMQALQSYKKL